LATRGGVRIYAALLTKPLARPATKPPMPLDEDSHGRREEEGNETPSVT